MGCHYHATFRAVLLTAIIGVARCLDEHIVTNKLQDAASSPERYKLRGNAGKHATANGVDDWGGWAPGNAATSALDSQVCNFDVRTDLMSVKEFVDKYVQAGRPVLLRGPA